MSDMRVAGLKLDEDRWRFHIPIHSWCLSLVVCFANSCVIVSSRTISNGQTLSELCDWTLQPGQPVHLLSCKQKDSQSPLAVYEFAITIWWLRISPSMTEIVLETANFSATRLRFVVRNAFTKNATLRFGLKLLPWWYTFITSYNCVHAVIRCAGHSGQFLRLIFLNVTGQPGPLSRTHFLKSLPLRPSVTTSVFVSSHGNHQVLTQVKARLWCKASLKTVNFTFAVTLQQRFWSLTRGAQLHLCDRKQLWTGKASW